MRINPVVEKELKIKMRGWRAPALITIYLGFLSLIVLLSFLPSIMNKYSMGTFNPSMAVSAYTALAYVQFFLIMFITPAITGGAISSERERQTLDLLLCTNFSPRSIVTGKVFVSISHIMLLISASLPIMATVFLFGGVALLDLVSLFLFYLVTALMIASIGIFYSTVFKKSTISIVITYITLMFLLIGTIIIYYVWQVFSTRNGVQFTPTSKDIMAFMFSNPIYGFSSAISGNTAGVPIFGILSRTGNLTGTLPSIFGLEIKPWMVNTAFNLTVTAIFIFLASFKIKPVKKPLFWKRRMK